MWKIITLVILLLIALVIVLVKPTMDGKSYRWLAWIPVGLALTLLVLSSFVQVHAKENGVGVAFGKPVAHYGAGVHFKPFWYSVVKINGTVYTDSYGTKGAKNPALPVRLGDGNPATAAVSLRWHVNPDAVDYIYSTYRSNDPAGSLRDAVVDTQLQAVVNNVFSSFNPTSDIQAVDLKDPLKASRSLNFSPNYTQMAADIDTQMLSAVKDAAGVPLVVIDKVTVSGVTYSSNTEARIAGIMAQVAKTQQAVQLEATNQALSNANGQLKNSLSGADGIKVLVQQCLNDLADGKFVAPAGFSCWPGSGSSVVIPGTTPGK